MPFTKLTTSQHCHYDAVACVVCNVRTATETEPAIAKPFGICVVGESATEFLEFNTQRWWPLPHCNGNGNSSSIACAIASVGSHIYQVGGLRGIPNEVLASCHMLQFGATEWSELPRMQHARCYAAAIGMGSLLYVVGGRGRNVASDSSSSFFIQLNSLEVYDTESKSWETKASMSTPRMAPAIIVLNATTIAVIGGYSDRGEWETSIEFYDISTDTWTAQRPDIPSMPTSVAFPKAVTIISNDQDSIVERIMVVGTCTLRSRSPQDTYTTIWMLDYESNSSTPNKWIKLISSNPKNRHKILLPNEGCAIALDPNSNTLYSIGGRAVKGTYDPSEKMSKQVLAWNISLDESTSAKDLQGLGFGLPLPGLGGGGHVLPASRGDTGYYSSSPRKQRQQLQRNMLQGRNFANTRRGSNTFSATDSQADVDGGSYEGSMTGDGYTNVTSPVSTHSRRYVRRQDDSTPKTISLGTDSSRKSNIDEDDEPVATIHVMDLEWTDRMGTVGRYTGSVSSADSPYPSAPHGKGVFVSDVTGDVFEGEWKNGRRNGQGRWAFNSTGDVFEGMFSNDRKHGRGNYQWRDGRCFEGNYENDHAEDLNGILTWKNGTLYVGAFRKGQRTGKGTIHFPSNNVKYSGEFRNGKYDGYGTCTFEDSKVYSGFWNQGKAHGTGKLVEADGTIIFEGAWEDDAPIF